MRSIWMFSMVVVAAGLAGCQAEVPAGLPGCTPSCTSGGGPTGGGGGGTTVQVRDNYYSPSTVTVQLGDTVTWNWVGSGQHSVTFPPGGWLPDLGVHVTGTISLIMGQSGTYSYYCTIQGSSKMSGTVTVQ
ncbi:MAG TPA: cupredoxin domain-containing protein [Gemmatimonadaceae bacterium]|nr:cupredoxin domain-containing protein [Gemmatimonadaceae bacterium]